MKITLQDLSDLAQVLGAIAVVVSLLLIRRQLVQQGQQLAQQTAIARAANAHKLVEMISPLRMQIIGDEKLAFLYLRGAENYRSLTDDDRFRYRRLIGWALHFYELGFLHWQRGLLEEREYRVWDVNLRNFIREHAVATIWAEIDENFDSEFYAHLREVLETPRAAENA